MRDLTVNFNNSDAADTFVCVLKEAGFGVIQNHPIRAELIQEVHEGWGTFFDSTDKLNYLYDKETHDGYFPYFPGDANESYHFYPWGRCPAKLDQKTRELFQQMDALAATLLSWMEKHSPEHVRESFSMPLSHMIKDSPKTLLKLRHYPAIGRTEEAAAAKRIVEHEDINLITLLPANTAGLQVKDTSGNWHDVVSDPGAIVVSTGDMLQICSGGYYKSTTHRIVHPDGGEAGKPRLCMPLFLHPCNDVRLSAEHTASTYLWQRLEEKGLT
jgi:isopenicillin N synthase-like dioxygenase